MMAFGVLFFFLSFAFFHNLLRKVDEKGGNSNFPEFERSLEVLLARFHKELMRISADGNSFAG